MTSIACRPFQSPFIEHLLDAVAAGGPQGWLGRSDVPLADASAPSSTAVQHVRWNGLLVAWGTQHSVTVSEAALRHAGWVRPSARRFMATAGRGWGGGDRGTQGMGRVQWAAGCKLVLPAMLPPEQPLHVGCLPGPVRRGRSRVGAAAVARGGSAALLADGGCGFGAKRTLRRRAKARTACLSTTALPFRTARPSRTAGQVYDTTSHTKLRTIHRKDSRRKPGAPASPARPASSITPASAAAAAAGGGAPVVQQQHHQAERSTLLFGHDAHIYISWSDVVKVRYCVRARVCACACAKPRARMWIPLGEGESAAERGGVHP